MRFLEMLAIALMAGCIGAGFVWFGWGIAENVGTLLRTGRQVELPTDDLEDTVAPEGE